jgi:hypothetical protein
MTDNPAPTKRLGDLCETISFSRWNVVVGSIVFVILGIPGVFIFILPFWKAYHAAKGHVQEAIPTLTLWEITIGWILVGLTCLCGISLIITGLIFFKSKRNELKHQFDFCANGFRYYFRGGLDRVLWSQVVCIREIVSSLPKKAGNHYKIIIASGKEYDFKGNSKAVQKFAALLRTRASELSLPWETAEER